MTDISKFVERQRFREYLYWRWRAKGYGKLVRDFESHQKFISALREKYIYPDYFDLVGPAQPEHGIEPISYPRSQRDPVCYLNELRQAELLLVGAISWNGLWIGTHEAVFGYVDDEPVWSDRHRGWYVALNYQPRKRLLTLEDIITPFRGFTMMKLEAYLLSSRQKLQPREAIRFRNGNTYDCQFSNLEVYSLRGRPMLCHGCGQRIGPDQSALAKVGKSTKRYCFEYLNWMQTSRIAPTFRRCIHRM